MTIAGAPIRIDEDEIRAERVAREKSRRHLIEFSEYMRPWYKAAAHHRIVGELLEQVEIYIRTRGKSGIGRLMLFEPPRHGKSEQVSRFFPAWLLGRLPDSNVILTSYGSSLAISHSRAVRDLIVDNKYANVFGAKSTKDVEQPVELSSDSRAVEAWDLITPHRGGLVAAGVGGAITGKGAHLLVIDDPYKNRAEADSEAHREGVMDWYRSSAYTRLEEGGAIVIMNTRWNVDDMAGQLIKKMARDPRADKWVIVSIPALYEPVTDIGDHEAFEDYQMSQMLDGVWIEAGDPLGREPGEALWPDKFNKGDIETIKNQIGPYDFAALYQQQPYMRSGNMFKREWFTIVDEPPAEEDIVARVRYWDKAATSGGGAHCSGVCLSLTKKRIVYVEHVERGQWSTFEREERMIAVADMDKKNRPGSTVIWHEQEPGGSGVDSAKVTNVNLAMANHEAHFAPVTGSKEVRAGPWSSALEGGTVRLVRAGWNIPYIEEHISFPKGKYKDQVDASAGAFSKLIDNTLEGDLFY